MNRRARRKAVDLHGRDGLSSRSGAGVGLISNEGEMENGFSSLRPVWHAAIDGWMTTLSREGVIWNVFVVATVRLGIRGWGMIDVLSNEVDWVWRIGGWLA